MGKTFYAQSDAPEPTMTVGELMDRLRDLDPAAPVIFRSPLYGSFGSNTAYSVEQVAPVILEAREAHYPANTYQDDETGEAITEEAYTETFPAWSGVVIS